MRDDFCNHNCQLDLSIPDDSFYKRATPDELIPFSSEQGRQLFKEALCDGHMQNYFPLIEQFLTQGDVAFCGISSLVMVLNALEIDPKKMWKKPWRWYDEKVADCCDTLPDIRQKGVAIPELLDIAKCNGLNAQAKLYSNSTEEEFREDFKRISQLDFGEHIIVSYKRNTIGQTGDAHYSPIGGYHPQKDLVLILDVARFKYPPMWVPLSLLWQAMAEHDPETNQSRGYIILKKAD